MSASALLHSIEEIFSDAGITINGPHPYDIRINNESFYQRVTADGSLGFGEAFMDGWWDCEALDELFFRLMCSDVESKVRRNWKLLLRAAVYNAGSKARAFQVGERHYDIGNDLYQAMLGKSMCYSCGYWKNAGNLDEAQKAKLELICRKLGLRPGDRILDIGCGWGSLIRHAAEAHGVTAVGITVSKEQAAFARESCAGLPVEIRLQDYRDIDEPFDHIASVGMFEHVGYKNYRTFMKTVRNCLKEDGLFLLHTIGENSTKIAMDPWFDRYIFPNALIPSPRQITTAAEGLLLMEDWQNFGPYYDTTLSAWFANVTRNWNTLQHRYDDRFYRMWKYYLLSSAGSFRARSLQVWQIVFSPRGVRGGYQSIR